MNHRNFATVLSLCCWSSWVVTSAFVIPTTCTAPVKKQQHHDDQHLLITTTKRYLYVDPNDAQHGQATIASSPKRATTKKTMTKEEFHRSLLEARLRIEKKAKTANQDEVITSKQQERAPVSSASLSSSLQFEEENPTIVGTVQEKMNQKKNDGALSILEERLAMEDKKQEKIHQKKREEIVHRSLLMERLAMEDKKRRQKSKSQVVMEPSKSTADVVVHPSHVVKSTGTTSDTTTNAYNFQRSLLEARLQMESRAKERENLFQVVGAASIASSTTTIADTDPDSTTTNIDNINDQVHDDERVSIPSSPAVVVVEDEDDIFATRTIVVAPPSESTDTTSSTIPTNTQSSSSSSYEFQRSLLEKRLQMEKLAASKKDKSTKKSNEEEEQASLMQDSMSPASSMTANPVAVSEADEPAVLANNISDKKPTTTTNGVMAATFDDDDASERKAKEIRTSITASVTTSTPTAKQPPMKDENILFDVLSSIKPADVLNTFTPEVGIVDLKEKTDDEIIGHAISNFGNVMKYGVKAVGDTAKLAFLSRSTSSDSSSSDLEATATSAAAKTTTSSSKTILDAAGMSTKGVVSVLTAMTALLWKKGGAGIDYFDQLQKERAEEQRKAEEARVEAKRIEEIERSYRQQSNAIKEEMDKKRLTQESIVSTEIHNLANNHKLMIDEKADIALDKALGRIRIEIQSEQKKRLQILQNNKDLLIAQKATPTTPAMTATPPRTPASEPSSTTKTTEIPFFATML